jgi:putative oxidoreductase
VSAISPQAYLRNQLDATLRLYERIPLNVIAVIARFAIAATFWKSGQTKIDGFAIDLVSGQVQLGWPRLADSAIFLFREEYHLPFAAVMAPIAAFAEHLFPLLLLIGLATRFAATALLIMTLVIQLFVYPDAYATHGVWVGVLLYLMRLGPGLLSIDQLLVQRHRVAAVNRA